MSIFPKRTIRGTRVTIHWNFNTAHLKNVSICPLVCIGVEDPSGKLTWLLNQHVLALPAVTDAEKKATDQFLYLNKNTPLMILADYLSGKQKKEKLVEILGNIESGRHYYFSYQVPDDAPFGKYFLISKVFSHGEVRYSKTAADDFFYVEKIEVGAVSGDSDSGYMVSISNKSPEPVPVKVIDFSPGLPVTPKDLQVFELLGMETRSIAFRHQNSYLSYNEERELIPLVGKEEKRCIRNQYFLELIKNEGEDVYLLNSLTDESYQLTPDQVKIWMMADGIHSSRQVREIVAEEQYDEMLAANIINEINL